LSILNQKELFVIITLKAMTTGIAGGFGGQNSAGGKTPGAGLL
jgi:hypothetical protein